MSAPIAFLDGRVKLHAGDCRNTLREFASSSIDSVVTDPPYALVSIVKRFGKPSAAPARGDVYARGAAGFMGKAWDTGEVAFAAEFWVEVLRVLKPGGHVVAFAGTRTYHRLACAIEDAGFEIRDQLAWVYGSGFPKSHDVSKGIDKSAGHWRGRAGAVKIAEQPSKGTEYERTPKGDPVTAAAAAWEGWGTALKPAWEPIVLARKPLDGTVADTVLAHGVGALNIDGCRVESIGGARRNGEASQDRVYRQNGSTDFGLPPGPRGGAPDGRWPANIVHDGSDEVLAAFPVTGAERAERTKHAYGDFGATREGAEPRGDTGSAARFFYSAKADADDRIGSKHPTVKPADLMRWLCRLVTPPGGVVLDPFAGTGTTGEAAWREGFSAILCEREAEYRDDIARRMSLALAGPATRRHESAKARGRKAVSAPLLEFYAGPDAEAAE